MLREYRGQHWSSCEQEGCFLRIVKWLEEYCFFDFDGDHIVRDVADLAGLGQWYGPFVHASDTLERGNLVSLDFRVGISQNLCGSHIIRAPEVLCRRVKTEWRQGLLRLLDFRIWIRFRKPACSLISVYGLPKRKGSFDLPVMEPL